MQIETTFYSTRKLIATVLLTVKNHFIRYGIKNLCSIPNDGLVDGTSIMMEAVADNLMRKYVEDQLNRVQFW
jgi:hypothetical protein